jgi:hypothetical protein
MRHAHRGSFSLSQILLEDTAETLQHKNTKQIKQLRQTYLVVLLYLLRSNAIGEKVMDERSTQSPLAQRSKLIA